MKKLIDTIKNIENVLTSLEVILKKEYHLLLNPNPKTFNDIDMLGLIKEKKMLFQKFLNLSQDRVFFEKKFGIFAPYENNNELNHCWSKIIKKCFLLREFNLQNKILMNKNFHLNQYFLEMFSSHTKSITYNFNGNLKI